MTRSISRGHMMSWVSSFIHNQVFMNENAQPRLITSGWIIHVTLKCIHSSMDSVDTDLIHELFCWYSIYTTLIHELFWRSTDTFKVMVMNEVAPTAHAQHPQAMLEGQTMYQVSRSWIKMHASYLIRMRITMRRSSTHAHHIQMHCGGYLKTTINRDVCSRRKTVCRLRVNCKHSINSDPTEIHRVKDFRFSIKCVLDLDQCQVYGCSLVKISWSSLHSTDYIF
jgi:hypothetical protein